MDDTQDNITGRDDDEDKDTRTITANNMYIMDDINEIEHTSNEGDKDDM